MGLCVTRVLLVLMYLLCYFSTASAGAYYLKPDTGLDTNPGTLAQPWKSMVKVRNTVNGGDIVNIIGGTYTRDQYQGEGGYPKWTQFHHHGSLGNPIIIQSNPGQQAIFDGGQDYYWMLFNPTAPFDYHVILRNLEFKNFRSSAISIYTDPTITGNYAGMYAGYLTVEGCYMHNYYDGGTGELSTQWAHHVILRNNRMDTIGLSHPTFGFSGTGDHTIYIAEGSQNIIIDGNILSHIAGFGIHLWGHFTVGPHPETPPTKNVSVRRNIVVNPHDACFIAAGATYQNLYVFNNTCYIEANPFPEISWASYGEGNSATNGMSHHNGGGWTHTIMVNNITYGTMTRAPYEVDSSPAFTDLVLDYNLWTNTGVAGQVYHWDGSYYTLATFRSATVYADNDLVASPLFTNAGARDFTLASGSPAIDAGRILTTATNNGSPSATLTVADAGYFHDGFGMIAGDSIKIGGSAEVLVTGVNYTTNTLTLAGTRTWVAGNEVGFSYNGSKPDIGALESGPVIIIIPDMTLPMPMNLRIITNIP